MCNIGIVLGDAGVKLPTAILFMNSNKSERNIRKKVAKAREKIMPWDSFSRANIR